MNPETANAFARELSELLSRYGAILFDSNEGVACLDVSVLATKDDPEEGDVITFRIDADEVKGVSTVRPR